MLLEIHVENFALMEQITVEFSPELNVLTGETGAGKSLLIDAIRFVLGERIDQIRMGTSKKTCRVEAIFELSSQLRQTIPDCDEYMDSEEDALILRREYNPETTRSRCQINGRTVTASQVKKITTHLLDIHGQYDHQLLFDPKVHIHLLDRFVQEESLKKNYKVTYNQYAALKRKKEELLGLQEDQEKELDILKFQIEEIEASGIEKVAVEELEQEHTRLANAEKLGETVNTLLQLLENGDVSIAELLGKATSKMGELAAIDPSVKQTSEELESSEIQIQEVVQSLQRYEQSITFDPEQLRAIEEKLDLIHTVERKYGGVLENVIKYLNESKIKYDQLINVTVYENEIDRELEKLLPEIKRLAAELTKKRKQAALSLKKTIERELKDLGIENAQFATSIEIMEFNGEGENSVEFLISSNLGQDLQPLQKIVSGGEVSRIMLALKKALCKVDPIPTLIFDEIDANIGGRMGTVTGEKLKQISSERQVLLITHLPQIASFAERHIKVRKKVKDKTTIADYQIVEGESRIQELAQMMSGDEETEISIKHAKELLAQGMK